MSQLPTLLPFREQKKGSIKRKSTSKSSRTEQTAVPNQQLPMKQNHQDPWEFTKDIQQKQLESLLQDASKQIKQQQKEIAVLQHALTASKQLEVEIQHLKDHTSFLEKENVDLRNQNYTLLKEIASIEHSHYKDVKMDPEELNQVIQSFDIPSIQSPTGESTKSTKSPEQRRSLLLPSFDQGMDASLSSMKQELESIKSLLQPEGRMDKSNSIGNAESIASKSQNSLAKEQSFKSISKEPSGIRPEYSTSEPKKKPDFNQKSSIASMPTIYGSEAMSKQNSREFRELLPEPSLDWIENPLLQTASSQQSIKPASKPQILSFVSPSRIRPPESSLKRVPIPNSPIPLPLRTISPISSRSPSPSKSTIIKERDELEEELLVQYGRLRRLESLEMLLLDPQVTKRPVHSLNNNK